LISPAVDGDGKTGRRKREKGNARRSNQALQTTTATVWWPLDLPPGVNRFGE
jgi:hypothetical protein